MHDYQREDPGWCGDRSRGASMGRLHDLDYEAGDRLTIRRVPLDEGGYDPGGSYWGTGTPLFCVSKDGFVTYLRAPGFEDAKAKFPGACWVKRFTDGDLADMLQGYAECILFTTVEEREEGVEEDGDVETLDRNYAIGDFSEETMSAMQKDCEEFIARNTNLLTSMMAGIDVDWYLLGHDFWLERSGSGGFDSGWPQGWSEALQSACDPWGECYSYVNNDGLIAMD